MEISVRPLDPVIAGTEARISGRPKSDSVTSVHVPIHHVSFLYYRFVLMEGNKMLAAGSSVGRVRGPEMASLLFAVAFRRYQRILVGIQ